MQKDWQRRYDFMALDEATLNAMLQPAFPGKSITAAELLTSGLCNTNYKVRLSGMEDAFVLRLYVRDRAACQKDYDLFNLVHKRVPVPEILYTNVAGERYATTYAVMRWVDGLLLSDVIAAGDTAQMTACAYAAGMTLASIGTYTFPQAGFFGPSLSIAHPFASAPFLTEIERSLFADRAGERLGTVLTERLWRFVRNNTGYLEAAEEVAALVHADFKGVNILVRQEQTGWHVAAVLDWEFALAGSPLIDIANMLRYDMLLPAAYETQFIRGYLDSGGTLPAEWKRTSKLLDLLSLCQFLDAPQANSALVEEVTDLIVSMMEHWKEYR